MIFIYSTNSADYQSFIFFAFSIF